jgi:hypothetical protein
VYRFVEQHLSETQCALVEQLVGRRVSGSISLSGGGNNRVYRVSAENMGECVVKFYFRSPSDPRDRLKTEFSACEFMWRHGVRCIPEPRCADFQHGIGVYSYLGDARVAPHDALPGDISDAVSFIKDLRKLSNAADARTLGDASEACFSARALVENVSKRVERLLAVSDEETEVFRRFLTARKELAHALNRIGGALEENALLLPQYQTLSPSDFGFHNAVRIGAGLAFYDFEYFGWDDPVKLVADFMLHPGSMASLEQRKQFFEEACKLFAEFEPEGQFAARYRRFFPLYQIKWCCIVMNEFVPEYRARRDFARARTADEIVAAQEKQLLKVEQLLSAQSGW